MRKATRNGKIRAYFLQLDIKNFFYTIDREILYNLIKKRINKNFSEECINISHANILKSKKLNYEIQFITHRLLRNNCSGDAVYIGRKRDFERVPAHKKLCNAKRNRGIPIGNLTSQFFANVYLNELDQFVKHNLKIKYFLRYVDDFVLVDRDKNKLLQTKEKIQTFLSEKLSLNLREDFVLKKTSQGADFLGYIVRQNYILVRRRVVGNLIEKLNDFEKKIVFKEKIVNGKTSTIVSLKLEIVERLRSVLSSYLGHFSHAKFFNIVVGLRKRYKWLNLIFRFVECRVEPLWEWNYFKHTFNSFIVLMQVGNRIEGYNQDAIVLSKKWTLAKQHHRARFERVISIKASNLMFLTRYIKANGFSYCFVSEQGYLKNNLKNRKLRYLWVV